MGIKKIEIELENGGVLHCSNFEVKQMQQKGVHQKTKPSSFWSEYLQEWIQVEVDVHT